MKQEKIKDAVLTTPEHGGQAAVQIGSDRWIFMSEEAARDHLGAAAKRCDDEY